MAATALRGIAAPLLAYVVMTFFGKIAALWMATGFWLIAGLFMARLDRTDGRALKAMNASEKTAAGV
jgi:hypothetical protein